MKLLAGELDIQEELQLDNNDLNLAGLHLHETLPSWINVHYDNSTQGWNIYRDCLRYIATSDRQDYYTFFHQHWSLFPLSFQSKLQGVNDRLFLTETPQRRIQPGRTWKFNYTNVLARQSWLFNQFKYLCEMRTHTSLSQGLDDTLWLISAINSSTPPITPIEKQTKQQKQKAEIAAINDTISAHNLLSDITDIPQERIHRWIKTLSVPGAGAVGDV
jgi:hypothetical protein